MSRVLRFPVERRLGEAAPLVPLVPSRGQIPDDIDSTLSDLARDPDATVPSVRNALFTAYGPILNRIHRKIWWSMARRDLVDRDDVANEGFLAFCDLLARWNGEGSFSRYLLARYSWRVRDRVAQLNGKRPPLQVAETLAMSANDSWQAERAIALLEELVAPLSPFDRQLVVSKVIDRFSARMIAGELGVSSSTIEARWAILRTELYRNLQLLLNNFE